MNNFIATCKHRDDMLMINICVHSLGPYFVVWLLLFLHSFIHSYSQTLQTFQSSNSLFEGWLNKFHLVLLKASLTGDFIYFIYLVQVKIVKPTNIYIYHTSLFTEYFLFIGWLLQLFVNLDGFMV